jgi:hypothetical protein
MKWWLSLLDVKAILTLSVLILGTTSYTVYGLGTRLGANEELCVFETVYRNASRLNFIMGVEEGGQFDVDYKIFGPDRDLLMEGKGERGADVIVTAEKQGDYRFCISNRMSTLSNKLVVFDVVVMNPDSAPDMTEAITSKKRKEEARLRILPSIRDRLDLIDRQTQDLFRRQKYIRIRERRSHHTIQNVESRIFWFLTCGSFLILLLSVIQVYLVRVVFLGNRGKTRTI